MNDPRRAATLAAALFLLTAAAFWPTLDLPFIVFDDPEYVTRNPLVLGGLTPAGIAWSVTTFHAANWHPMTWVSHMVDVSLSGVDPGRHHATNLLIHCTNVVLLFLLLARTTGAPWRSALAAALFGVHPLRVESVAWVSERKDVLGAFFWLASTAAYVGWTRRPGPARYLAAVTLFALGLASKPMLVTLPFTLVLLDLWPLGRMARERPWKALWPRLREKAPFFVLCAASCVVTYLAQLRGGAVQPLVAIPLGARLSNALASMLFYLAKAVIPGSLAIFYPYPDPPYSLAASLAMAALLGGITVAALRSWRTAPFLTVGWLWFTGTLVPVLGLVQVGGQQMADRYTYIPSIGLAIIVAWSVPRIGSRWRVATAGLLAAFVLLLTVATRSQLRHWRDGVSLFGHAAAVTEGNWLAETALGMELERRGDPAEAIRHYRQALSIRPLAPDALNNLGNALVSRGDLDEGLHHLREAVRAWPDFALALNNLGSALCESGHVEEGADHLRRAVQAAPDYIPARFNLGLALASLGRTAEAISQFESVLRLSPRDDAAAAEVRRLQSLLRRSAQP